MTNEIWTFVTLSIPIMVILGVRHALDVDHITTIDTLLRLHSAQKNSRWIGSGFSFGHMIAVIMEMLFIILILNSVTKAEDVTFWGGLIGAAVLGIIGMLNIFSMRKVGKTGSSILAYKVLSKTKLKNPLISSLIVGLIFGLGFDTATQISGITLTSVVTATSGIQIALILTAFFAIGMISLDTLDSVILRSTFHKILDKRGFRYMSYALSSVAIAISLTVSFETFTNTNILPELAGPILTLCVIMVSILYSLARSSKIKNFKYLKSTKNPLLTSAMDSDKTLSSSDDTTIR